MVYFCDRLLVTNPKTQFVIGSLPELDAFLCLNDSEYQC